MLIEKRATQTLTPVEMRLGDELRFTLADGRVVSMILEATDCRVLITSLLKSHEETDGGTVLEMTARVRVDGQVMRLVRYLCAQESFYEPWVINGMRLWLDAVDDLFRFATETHGPCRPEHKARFAVQDATLPICPDDVALWCPRDAERIDITECYNGDDCWMGPYLGYSVHGGLDINHPAGTPLFSPIALDDQYFYNTVVGGSNNNRWRGVRRWDDGAVWELVVCHLIELTVDEHAPLALGQEYARAAGVWVGSHDHSHFVLKVTHQGSDARLDPWILFWQAFENRKRDRGDIHAAIAPLVPATVGEPVRFKAEGCRDGGAGPLRYFWTFGDGGTSDAPEPEHVFADAGVYPVTLTVENAAGRLAACTQHLTVGEGEADSPVLAMWADEPSFDTRPVEALDVYGDPVQRPCVIELLARASRPQPAERAVLLSEPSGAPIFDARATLRGRADWLTVGVHDDAVHVQADATGLAPGDYQADVQVTAEGALNSPQSFRVRLRVVDSEPASDVTIDDADAGCRATPFFWVAPQFWKWPTGHGPRWLTNGARADDGEFVRYTPDLGAGRYEVSLGDKTPYDWARIVRVFGPSRFNVRVHHAGGDDWVRMTPGKAAESRVVGTFEFDQGADGFVEIHAADSSGQVLADAVRFRRID